MTLKPNLSCTKCLKFSFSLLFQSRLRFMFTIVYDINHFLPELRSIISSITKSDIVKYADILKISECLHRYYCDGKHGN